MDVWVVNFENAFDDVFCTLAVTANYPRAVPVVVNHAVDAKNFNWDFVSDDYVLANTSIGTYSIKKMQVR